MTVRLRETPTTRRLDLGAGVMGEATCDPRSPIVDEFYALYDRSFVLENEKENLSGFQACLSLNEGEAYARLGPRSGPYRESVLVARRGSAVIAGANYIAFADDQDKDRPLVTVNLNYIFVSEEARRRGVFRRLVAAVQQDAADAFDFGAAPRVLIFVEMNDPVRMNMDAYARDSAHSGLDQIDRLRIWNRLGAKLIDFNYVQPALSGAQQADDTLLYGVLGAERDELGADILLRHLEGFFSVSVLKGRDAYSDPLASAQLNALSAQRSRGVTIRLAPLEAAEKATPDELSKHANFLDYVRRSTGAD